MDPTLTDVLRNTLDKLAGTDFKRFKHKLRDQNKIPWGKLERADTDDTVDLMVQVYTSGAGSTMATILKEMNQNNLAMELERELGKLGGQQHAPGQAGGGGGGSGGVTMNIAAHSGGMVNAPALTGCNFGGPVNFSYGGNASK